MGQNHGIKLITKSKYLNDMELTEYAYVKDGLCTNSSVIVNEKQNKSCFIHHSVEKTHRIISTDTTEDRPCCCKPVERNGLQNNVCKMVPSIIPKAVKVQDSNLTKNSMPIKDSTTCIKVMNSCDPCIIKERAERAKQHSSVACGSDCKKYLREKPNLMDTSCSEYRKDEDNKEKSQKKKKTETSKSKKVKCKCPEPEFLFSKEDWISESQIRKMKSDMTQTVSGFKLNKQRKIDEPEMSFEEILQYYAEQTEQKYNLKKSKLKKKNTADCECPPQAVPPSSIEIEKPLKGITFKIGGKGSKSKGLAGILCFPLHSTSTSMF